MTNLWFELKENQTVLINVMKYFVSIVGHGI